MRQLHVQIRPEHAQRVLELGEEHRAFSPTMVAAGRPDGEDWRMVFLNLPNDQVGAFVGAVREEVSDAQFVLFPWGTLPVQTPVAEVHQRLRDVAPLSTTELVLGSLQSLGSWKALLLYAAFSGIVAAYGLIVNASYMLVAAMLIAPMGAPGMVAVVGTAIGDVRMAGRGTWRFLVAVLVLVATAAVVGWGYDLDLSTVMMEQVSALSAWTVVVALVAGAAGAQSQVQSERSSLVTATATGFLIAAALSPSSAVAGLSIPLGRWDYVALMSFVVALQFVALLAGGWLALRLYGIQPGDPTVGRGSQRGRSLLAGAATAAVILLVAWQLSRPVAWRKADVARAAATVSRSAVEEVAGARLIEASAHFTRPDLASRNGDALLVNLIVEHLPAAGGSAAELESAVRSAVSERVSQQFPDVLPFVTVTAVPAR